MQCTYAYTVIHFSNNIFSFILFLIFIIIFLILMDLKPALPFNNRYEVEKACQ